ncbi:unnamed protein product, partial [Closterium sp. NIES-54]
HTRAADLLVVTRKRTVHSPLSFPSPLARPFPVSPPPRFSPCFPRFSPFLPALLPNLPLPAGSLRLCADGGVNRLYDELPGMFPGVSASLGRPSPS